MRIFHLKFVSQGKKFVRRVYIQQKLFHPSAFRTLIYTAPVEMKKYDFHLMKMIHKCCFKANQLIIIFAVFL